MTFSEIFPSQAYRKKRARKKIPDDQGIHKRFVL